jgi:small subunit ribosomal protein S16
MLTIRLSRVGKPKKPTYRLIISEKTKDPYGDALEILGSYNPFTKELNLKNDRLTYWLGKGAKMSPTVNNLLITKEIIKGEKVKVSRGKKAAEAKAKETKPADTKTAEPKQE